MKHQIKILEQFADAVLDGSKNFEIRKNDRGYRKGDIVEFYPIYNDTKASMLSHPLRGRQFEITYVLQGWGLQEGYCVFGIKEVKGEG